MSGPWAHSCPPAIWLSGLWVSTSDSAAGPGESSSQIFAKRPQQRLSFLPTTAFELRHLPLFFADVTLWLGCSHASASPARLR